MSNQRAGWDSLQGLDFEPVSPRKGALLRCHFCGLGEGQVSHLFEGRSGYICNECVEVCAQLLADYRELGFSPPVFKAPWYKRWLVSEGARPDVCSFCGRARGGSERLLASARTQICERCVRDCEGISGEGLRL